MPTHADLRRHVVAALRAGAQAHDEGRFQDIGSAYDRLAEATTQGGSLEADLRAALGFLESWYDSSNHDWCFYEPLARDDWPRLGLELANDIEAERPINPVLRDRFTG